LRETTERYVKGERVKGGEGGERMRERMRDKKRDGLREKE